MSKAINQFKITDRSCTFPKLKKWIRMILTKLVYTVVGAYKNWSEIHYQDTQWIAVELQTNRGVPMVMPIQKHLKCVCEHQTWIQKWWWWCLIDHTGYMCLWLTWRIDNVYSFSLQLYAWMAEVICYCAWALVEERKLHNIFFQVGANSM